MDRRNLKWITWGFVAATVLIVALMLGNTLRRTSYITLPQNAESGDHLTEEPGISDSALTIVEVTPETVQAAVATLTRPENYRRTVTVEQFWEGGSGSYETIVTVLGDWTRTDRTMPDGRVRHAITGSETAYIWYSHEETYFSAAVGAHSGDHEQTIPTYEDVLELDPAMIADADYRPISDINCIYVETHADSAGYALRYWVSVDTGLLTVAEKLLNDEPVYRMAALTTDQGVSDAASFVLPDGTELI